MASKGSECVWQKEATLLDKNNRQCSRSLVFTLFIILHSRSVSAFRGSSLVVWRPAPDFFVSEKTGNTPCPILLTMQTAFVFIYEER